MKLLIFGLVLCVTTFGIALHADINQSKPLVVILLGPPGSGKGTQAVRLSQELKIPHISTGDLFRENLSKNTDLGKKAKSYMDGGQLVPDEVVLEMLFDRVSRPDCVKGYLLDGFPRTIPQAEALERHLQDTANVIALNLQVKDELIFKRAEGRMTCKCGQTYNKYFSPPKIEGKCDKCESALYQRTDDAAAVVQERLKVYHLQTEPLIEFYQKKGLLVSVNGENAPDVVFQELLKAIGPVLKA